jgi:branched-chain amino acid transport system permease protein
VTAVAKRLRGSAGGRDLVFAVSVLVVAVGATLPGLAGDGAALANMQVIGVAFATVVAAVGLNLLTGYARLVSLGQGAFYAVGAYASAWLTLDGGLPWPVAMLAAVAAAAAFGALVALGSMRLRGPQFAMITLVLAVLVERVLAEWNPLGRLSGYPNPVEHGSGMLEPIRIGGFKLDPPLFAGVRGTLLPILAIALGVVLILYRNLSRSAWGLSLRAIGESEHLAAHLGVNVFARKVVVFTLSAGLGALGGIFYAQAFAHLQPETFGLYLSLTLVLAVILGGGGTVLGPVVGAVIIVVLQQTDALSHAVDLQKDMISQRWYLSVPGLVGLLLVIVLYVLPEGIVGTTHRFLSKRCHTRRRVSGEDRAAAAAPSSPADPGEPDRPVPGDPLLVVEAVTKRFGGLTAAREMNLMVRSGSIHAVIGPNGAGKTTLANLITGVYKPDEGKIRLEEEVISDGRIHSVARAGIARTFQTPLIFAEATVRENVLAGFRDTGTLSLWRAAFKPPSAYRRDTERRAAADALLARVGLLDQADLQAGNLSYGRQRALEVARALAGHPRLLMLDEPAAGLNPTEAADLGRLLASLRASGLAMILIEHHMDLVTEVADEVTCMNQGALLAHGTARDVLADPAVVAAYLGTGRTDDSSRVRPDHPSSLIGEESP